MNCPTCGCPEMVCPVCDNDPTLDLVHANIETTKDIYEKGLRKVRDALKNSSSPDSFALAIIDAALCFHPMHGESWPGWPRAPWHPDEKKPADAAREGGA